MANVEKLNASDTPLEYVEGAIALRKSVVCWITYNKKFIGLLKGKILWLLILAIPQHKVLATILTKASFPLLVTLTLLMLAAMDLWWMMFGLLTDMSLFQFFITLKSSVTIHLPNKPSIIAFHSGLIALHPKVHLHNTLFVQSFHYNLLSVSKLL